MRRNPLKRTGLFLVCFCLLFACGFAAAPRSGASAADGAAVLPAVSDFSGSAWRADRSGCVSGNGYTDLEEDYVTDRSFGGDYTFSFHMRVNETADFANDALFRLAIGNALTIEVREGDVVFPGVAEEDIVRHYLARNQSVSGGNELYRYYGGAIEPYAWCPFKTEIVNNWNDNIKLSGMYRFTVTTRGNEVDLSVMLAESFSTDETKYPSLMYTVKTETAPEGKISFTRGDSACDISVGAMRAESSDNSFLPWKDQLAMGDKTYVDPQGEDLGLYSNFTMGETWSAVYEVRFGLSTAWNDRDARVEFVFGVTDANPQGKPLGFVSASYVGYFSGNAWQDIAPHGGNGLFYRAIRVKLASVGYPWMQFSYSTQNEDGTWSDFAIADLPDNPNDPNSQPSSAHLERDFGLTSGAGGIGIRTVNAKGTAAPFTVKLVELTGTVADSRHFSVAEQDVSHVAISADGAPYKMQLPRVALWSPSMTETPAYEWTVVSGGENARVVDPGVLEVLKCGEVQLKLSVPSLGIEETVTFAVTDDDKPIISAEEEFFLAEDGDKLTREQILALATAKDNSGACDFALAGAKRYANQKALREGAGTDLAEAGGEYTLSGTGIVVFTLSATDAAHNEETLNLTWYVQPLTLANAPSRAEMTEAGAIVRVDLPAVTTVADSYEFRVLSGAASIGMGADEGKLLVFGVGEIRVAAVTSIDGVTAEFTLTAADKIAPQIAIGIYDTKLPVGSALSLAAVEAAIAVTDPSGTSGSPEIKLEYYATLAAAEEAAGGESMSFEGEVRLTRAGYYLLRVTATDGAGNAGSAALRIEVVAEQARKAEGNALKTVAIVLGCVGGAAAAAVAAVMIVWRKKRNERT